jgi:hypothetical protein
MTRVYKRVKSKAPPKPPSGDRDYEGEGEGGGSKSLRLANFSPPANVVQVKDKSNTAIVVAGDECQGKVSIAMDTADAPAISNKDLFSINIRGVITSYFPSQSLANDQEPFLNGLKTDMKCADYCSHELTL